MAETPDLFGSDEPDTPAPAPAKPEAAPAAPERGKAPEAAPADPRADFERALAVADPETRKDLLARFDKLDPAGRKAFADKFTTERDSVVAKFQA